MYMCVHMSVCMGWDYKNVNRIMSLDDKATNACFLLIYIFQIFSSEQPLFL